MLDTIQQRIADLPFTRRALCFAPRLRCCGVHPVRQSMFNFDNASDFESVPAMYETLVSQARSLFEGEPDRIANAANLAALVYHTVPDLNWAGFYFYDGNELVLGPFQGRIACVRIAIGKGVCGTAAATGQPQLVPDVLAFAGHIACDAASRSEIVIPLHKDNRLIGVWDVDSPRPGRFTQEDQAGMQALCQVWLNACGSVGQ